MEYVNVNALARDYTTPPDVRNRLLERFAPVTPGDTVIATDSLELLRGGDLVEAALAKGEPLVPLRRVSAIRETSRFPKRVLLELTSKCNSFCTMCPRNILTREECHMDTQLAKETIRQLAEVGISGLWLYNIGESLLHPNFFDILGYCRKFDSLGTLWLSTNGEIMHARMREKVLAHPVDVLNYSVNAMSEEGYRHITPNLRFHRVQANLKALIARRAELGQRKPIIRAQMIEIPEVAHEIEEFKQEYGGKADILSINKLEVFSQNVEANTRGSEIVVNRSIPHCNRLEREDFFIFSDGSVSCCDTDFNCVLNIGNVREQSLREIYDGNRYQGLIRQYREGRLHERDLCSRCRDFNL